LFLSPSRNRQLARPELQGVSAERVFRLAGAARRLLTAGNSVSIPVLVYRRRRFGDIPPNSCPDDAINKQQVNFK